MAGFHTHSAVTLAELFSARAISAASGVKRDSIGETSGTLPAILGWMKTRGSGLGSP